MIVEPLVVDVVIVAERQVEVEQGWKLIGFLKISKSVGHLFFEVVTKLHLVWIYRRWSGAGPFR